MAAVRRSSSPHEGYYIFLQVRGHLLPPTVACIKQMNHTTSKLFRIISRLAEITARSLKIRPWLRVQRVLWLCAEAERYLESKINKSLNMFNRRMEDKRWAKM